MSTLGCTSVSSLELDIALSWLQITFSLLLVRPMEQLHGILWQRLEEQKVSRVMMRVGKNSAVFFGVLAMWGEIASAQGESTGTQSLCPLGMSVATIEEARAGLEGACDAIDHQGIVRLAGAGQLVRDGQACEVQDVLSEDASPIPHWILCTGPDYFVEQSQDDNAPCGPHATQLTPEQAQREVKDVCATIRHNDYVRLADDVLLICYLYDGQVGGTFVDGSKCDPAAGDSDPYAHRQCWWYEYQLAATQAIACSFPSFEMVEVRR